MSSCYPSRPWKLFSNLWLFLVGCFLFGTKGGAQRFACDPCVTRSTFIIQAFVHGTASDPYWQQLQASAEQAALDMGVQFEMNLYDSYNPQLLAQDIRNAATSLTRRPNRPDALLVTIPNEAVAESVAFAIEQGIPCFGLNTGYQISPTEMMGFIGQDEFAAGQLAGHEFLRLLSNSTLAHVQPRGGGDDGDDDSINSENTDQDGDDGRRELANQDRQQLATLFINHEAGNPTLDLRKEGFKLTLGADVRIDEVVIDPQDVIGRVTKINEAMRGCPYDFVLIGGAASVEVTLAAIQDNGCHDTTLTGAFDTSPKIYSALLQDDLCFAFSQQQYLQGALPVVLATIYTTAGKGLPVRHQQGSNFGIPLRQIGASSSHNESLEMTLPEFETNATGVVYPSGPIIVRRDNIPSDTQQACEVSAFPVCTNDRSLAESFAMTTKCDCTDRSRIRIGGVVHGTTHDEFWDPVFAAAEEAAIDMDVMLEMERFGPTQDHALIETKMASKIKSLCESGVSGIFVSIPSDAVTDAIQLCLDLEISVISINTGAGQSKELKLLTHVGQNEYKTGFEAGKRLLDAGVSRGYCVNHLPDVVAMEERCNGFRDAIQQAERGRRDLSFGGVIVVPQDHDEQYVMAVESKIGQDGGNGVGLLVTGASQLSGALKVKAKHERVVVGIFDVWDGVFEPLDDGRLLFAVDQQPYLQGSLPVHLLAYRAYTHQALISPQIETGPAGFVERSPSKDEQICEANLYQVCRAARAEENYNYISSSLVWLGRSMSLITILMALGCIGWTLFYQNRSPLVSASQPPFLVVIALGAIMSSLAINALGAQTAYRQQMTYSVFGGITTEPNPDIGAVDAACMAVPWLYGTGFVLMFSALFAKIIRVKLIYDAGRAMRRQTVGIRDVSWIFFKMIAIEFAVLLSWQLVSPFKWEREVTIESAEGLPLESVGECTSDEGWWFLLGQLLFHVVCLFYALALCFQTKNLPTKFSESSYVSLAVMCIFQVSVLVLPIGAMVRDSPDAFYFVRACAIFLQNFTVLCLIFGPKMIKVASGEDSVTASYARTTSSRALGRRGSHVTDYSKMSSGRLEEAPSSKQDSPGGKRISFMLDSKDCEEVCDFDREKSGEFVTLIKCPKCASYFEERIPLYDFNNGKSNPSEGTIELSRVGGKCSPVPEPGESGHPPPEPPFKRDSKESVDSFHVDTADGRKCDAAAAAADLMTYAQQFQMGLSSDDDRDSECFARAEKDKDFADAGKEQEFAKTVEAKATLDVDMQATVNSDKEQFGSATVNNEEKDFATTYVTKNRSAFRITDASRSRSYDV